MRWLITGGAGFIGSALVRRLLRRSGINGGSVDAPAHRVIVMDKLTYAGNLDNLEGVLDDPRLIFVKADIADTSQVSQILASTQPDILCNLAAESHVDRSLVDAAPFMRTNVLGTQILLDAWRSYGGGRFLQVSTDEIYGSLADSGCFHEDSPLNPTNPYAASKAAAELLVRAAVSAWKMDVVITRSTNNFGPRQHPEKLVPRTISRALRGEDVLLYGSGGNIRDWLWVHDNCEGLVRAALLGRAGECYNLGASQERTNRQVVESIVDILGLSRTSIRYVPDRPGNDWRYALDSRRAKEQLGWEPVTGFQRALEETVRWYQDHRSWLEERRVGNGPQLPAELTPRCS